VVARIMKSTIAPSVVSSASGTSRPSDAPGSPSLTRASSSVCFTESIPRSASRSAVSVNTDSG
jgi:hypothetical protein